MKKFIVFFIAFIAFTSLKAQNSPSQPQSTTPAPKPTPQPAEATVPQNDESGNKPDAKISGASKTDKEKQAATVAPKGRQ
jgi:hypothetical protein